MTIHQQEDSFHIVNISPTEKVAHLAGASSQSPSLVQYCAVFDVECELRLMSLMIDRQAITYDRIGGENGCFSGKVETKSKVIDAMPARNVCYPLSSTNRAESA